MARLLLAHPPPDDFRTLRDERGTLFQSLCRTIVFQQLAGKAAQTIFDRFVALFSTGAFPTPAAVVAAPMERLRSAGLSERKASYLQDLAARVVDGRLALDRLAEMSDEEIAAQLVAVRGIGQWTVDMFLIFQLNRPDILPLGDLGVQKGMMEHFGLRQLPSREHMLQLAEPWRPYRSVGAWLMWRVKDAPGPATAALVAPAPAMPRQLKKAATTTIIDLDTTPAPPAKRPARAASTGPPAAAASAPATADGVTPLRRSKRARV